jgi:urease accessory protein
MKTLPSIARITCVAAASVATPAYAHSASALTGGFLAGFAHPLAGPDHLLAMVAVGLWGAFLGRPLIVLLPVIFPTMMAFGGILGMIATPMPPVELGVAISVVMLGGAVAGGWRAPAWLACVAVAVFAIFHGYAHGSELPSMADPVAFSLGFVIATGMLHVAGIAIGLLTRRPAGAVFVRGLGVIVLVAGCYYMVRASGFAP